MQKMQKTQKTQIMLEAQAMQQRPEAQRGFLRTI
jgi:hypothetical protein